MSENRKFFHELKDVRLSADSSGELDIFDHDGAALGVYGEQVRVLHEDSQVHFSRLLHTEKCNFVNAMLTT